MDGVFEAALAREAELEQELKKIRDFLSTYRVLAHGLKLDSLNTDGTKADQSTPKHNPVDNGRQDEGGGAPQLDATPARRGRVTGNPKPSDVVAAAADVIRTVGRPLTRRQIHNALARRGIVVRGADPIKALGTMLWRSGGDILQQIDGRGYWLQGEELPPALDVSALTLDDLFTADPIELSDPE